MAETRAQALLKETVTREAEEAFGNRFEALEKAIAVQNEKIAIQNDKTERSIAEMLEAFRLMTSHPSQPGPSTSETRNVNGGSLRNSGTHDLHYEHQQPQRHTNYHGMSRMTKDSRRSSVKRSKRELVEAPQR
uniref:Uncharacterized protein n=1 Tax=Brassica campestris TaxID=3711 RepID=M4EGX8_BRACM